VRQVDRPAAGARCHAILGVLDAGAFTIAIAADGRDKGLVSGSDE
jgi:hypothetical protein